MLGSGRRSRSRSRCFTRCRAELVTLPPSSSSSSPSTANNLPSSLSQQPQLLQRRSTVHLITTNFVSHPLTTDLFLSPSSSWVSRPTRRRKQLSTRRVRMCVRMYTAADIVLFSNKKKPAPLVDAEPVPSRAHGGHYSATAGNRIFSYGRFFVDRCGDQLNS